MAHRVAPAGESDLADIWYFVAKERASLDIANRLIDVITDRFYPLLDFPILGALAMNLAPDAALSRSESTSLSTQSTPSMCSFFASFMDDAISKRCSRRE